MRFERGWGKREGYEGRGRAGEGWKGKSTKDWGRFYEWLKSNAP